VTRVNRLLVTVAAVGVGSLMIAGFAASSVSAATANANLGVSASVASNCTISTAALAFGAYDPVGANASTDLPGTGTVTIACTRGTSATIGLGLGSNASGSTRRMTDGSSNYLTYELYQDSGHATVWSDAGSGLLSPAAAPSKAARNFTVYGLVTSNQDVPTGNYNDTVVASVNF
jgi:spore coat protein U-like protein